MGILVVDASQTGTTVNVGATNETYFTTDQTLTALNIAVLTSVAPSLGLAGLAVQPVPEPGSVTLILGGLFSLIGTRRRRR